MSDDSTPKNVASIWILVVLVGGLSVPFWRWDSTSKKGDEPLQWVEQPGDSGDDRGETSVADRVTGDAQNLTLSHDAPSSELLHEFVASDPSMRIQDAVRANQDRPGIPKQFQGEGIPLTDIKPWIPKPNSFDATPTDHQKLAGTVNAPIQAQLPSTSPNGNSNLSSTTATGLAWPDSGFAAGQTSINPPTMFYRADPKEPTAPISNMAGSNMAAPNTNAVSNINPIDNVPISSPDPAPSPGRMVSSSHVTDSDPPALRESFHSEPNSMRFPDGSVTNPKASGSNVSVKPSPTITPPANPLRGGNTSSRSQGTVIRQPKSGN